MKTTILGILTIAGTVINGVVAMLQGHQPDIPSTIAGVTAGWGLIHASDATPKA